MVARPCILMFGDHRGLQGGNQPIAQIASTSNPVDAKVATSELWDMALHQVIPNNGNQLGDTGVTSAESAAATMSWWPWYDGSRGDLATNSGNPFVLTAVGTNTATVAGAGWTVNEWAGYTLTINNPSGYGQTHRAVEIASNTADTITITAASWAGGNPSVGAGMWFNQGRLVDYHPVSAWRTIGETAALALPVRGGGSWQTKGLGVGYDAGLLRELLEHVYPVAPFFQVFKWAPGPRTGYPNGNQVSDYAAAGADRTAFEAELAKHDAAFAARYPGDTQTWPYCIFDLSQGDVDEWTRTPADEADFVADLTATIAWLRTAVGNPSMRVLLINHDPVLRAVDAPGKTAAANGYQAAVAALDSNVRTVPFEPGDFPTRGTALTATLWLPNEDREGYNLDVYANRAPELIRRHVELWEAGAAPTSDGAIPMYLLIGDSIEVGAIPSTYSADLISPTLTTTARDSRQLIWNRDTQALEPYHAHNNSQTSGSPTPTIAGPEFALMHELMQRHPDGGFILVKRAGIGSGMATQALAYALGSGGRWLRGLGEHYEELVTDVEGATQYANVVLGKQVSLQAIFVGLGTNDQSVAGGGDAFAGNLDAFVGALREDFGTHPTGKATPIIWRQPHLGTATALPGEAEKVRLALRARASRDTQFQIHNVDHLERQVDNIHETPDSCIERGREMDDQLGLVALPNC